MQRICHCHPFVLASLLAGVMAPLATSARRLAYADHQKPNQVLDSTFVPNPYLEATER